MKSIDYKVWWPEEGESEEDATYYPPLDCPGRIAYDLEDVAEEAAHYDYDYRDGFSRNESTQVISVKDTATGVTETYEVLRDFDVTFSAYKR